MGGRGGKYTLVSAPAVQFQSSRVGKSLHIPRRPESGAQNAYIERFNGTYRTEVLDAHCFLTLDHVRAETAKWMPIYNEQRSHKSIGKLPTMVFKRRWQERQSLFSNGSA